MSAPSAAARQPRAAASPPPLRCSPIPRHEPRAASRISVHDDQLVAPTQGTLALVLPLEFDTSRSDAQPLRGVRQRSSELSIAGGSGGGAHFDDDEPITISVGLLPEPKAWASTFIQAAMEVAGGLRSAGQMVRWTTPEVHGVLARRGALTARARRSGTAISAKPRLRTMLTCMPLAGICEVSAVIAEPERVRAVAFRMEGMHGRWRVTELEIG